MSADRPFVSYAQNHEDVVLARALRPDRTRGFWVDVGAGDPVHDSVTAAFSERGWTGINIEPLAAEHAALEAARPHDVNLCLALGSATGTAKLWVGPPENRGASTMVEALADRYAALGEDFHPVEVPVETLRTVVERHVTGRVDFLKIDVEGFELEVLSGADWVEFHPRVVVVEATIPNTDEAAHHAWEPILLDAGYELALFDGLNRFYASADEPALLAALAVPAGVVDGFVAHRSLVERAALEERVADAQDWATSLQERAERAEHYAEDLQQALQGAERHAGELDRAFHDAERTARHALDRAAIAEEHGAALQGELVASQMVAARALAAAQEARAELHALRATRTYRYTAGLRAVYAGLRRRTGR